MQGRIISCVNQGSLVQILVETEDGLESIPVDHRCFQQIVEVKGDIREKEIEYDEEKGSIFFEEDRTKEKCSKKIC